RQGDIAESTTDPGWQPEDGNFRADEHDFARSQSNQYGHLLVSCPARWDFVWLRPGIVMGKEGDLATFIGQGVGTIKKDGAVSYRGAVYYQSSSPRWSRLNSVAAIFEHEVDPEGNVRSQFWEWK